MTFGNIRSGELGIYMCQLVWVLLCMQSGTQLLAFYGTVIQDVSTCAHATMSIVATLLSLVFLLQVGLCPTQLFFKTVQERMTAQYPPATKGPQPSLASMILVIFVQLRLLVIVLPILYILQKKHCIDIVKLQLHSLSQWYQ